MTETPFEIPQSLPEVCEQSLEHAHAAYNQVINFMGRAMDAWVETMPPNPMTAGFKDVNDRVLQFARDNGDHAFAFSCQISSTRTLSEMLNLQSQFAQDRMEAFTAQTQELHTLIEDAFHYAEAPRMAHGIRKIASVPIATDFTLADWKAFQSGVSANREDRQETAWSGLR